jgi:hypothetical protein
LEDRVVEKYGLEAKGEEMDAFAKRYIVDQFMQYGMPRRKENNSSKWPGVCWAIESRSDACVDTIVEQKLISTSSTLLSPKEAK